MYTRCPKCETVFHITMEQLQAHSGTVRCGRCDNVFSADQQLFSDVPDKAAEKPAIQKKVRAPSSGKPRPAKAKATNVATSRSSERAKPATKAPTADEEIDAAPAPWSPPVPMYAKTPRRSGVADKPTALTLDALPPATHRLSALWIVGIIVFAFTLAAQSIYFYRDSLAVYPRLRPYLIQLCVPLDCHVRPPYDVIHLELVQPTNIAPHPRIANALRLRATLVSRANNAQPHPFMQITLTDSAGRVLARRVFSPRQYLEQPASAATDMPPHLAISALIDLTNPDGKAVGYQIDFLPPPPH